MESCTIWSGIGPPECSFHQPQSSHLAFPASDGREGALTWSPLLAYAASRWLAETHSPLGPPHRAECHNRELINRQRPSPLFVHWEGIYGAFLPNTESKFCPRPDVDPCGCLPTGKASCRGELCLGAWLAMFR